MTYVAAYNSLGFSTAVLGEDRANSAGKRAMQLGREGRLFTADPVSYTHLERDISGTGFKRPCQDSHAHGPQAQTADPGKENGHGAQEMCIRDRVRAVMTAS